MATKSVGSLLLNLLALGVMIVIALLAWSAMVQAGIVSMPAVAPQAPAQPVYINIPNQGEITEDRIKITWGTETLNTPKCNISIFLSENNKWRNIFATFEHGACEKNASYFDHLLRDLMQQYAGNKRIVAALGKIRQSFIK